MSFFAFTVIPIATSIYYSFTNYDILKAPVWNGIANFRTMMHDELFWKSLQVTFVYTFSAVPLRLAFALFIAMLLNRKLRWDPQQQQFLGDEEAKAMLDRPMRQPWVL